MSTRIVATVLLTSLLLPYSVGSQTQARLPRAQALGYIRLLARLGAAERPACASSPEARATLSRISSLPASSKTDDAKATWKSYVRDGGIVAKDARPLVAYLVRSTFIDRNPDLGSLADRLRYNHELRVGLEFNIARLKAARAGGLQKTIQLKRLQTSYTPGVHAVAGYWPRRIETAADLDTYLENWEDMLDSIGDDAQLSNVDLQTVLQKQQQTLQMLSDISKVLYDTAMSVIRKLAG